MKKIWHNRWALAGVSVLVLGVSFLLCRYVLFSLHGMKQWPLILACAALAIIILALLFSWRHASLCAAVGYPLGFAVGLVFHTGSMDTGGGAADNLWLLWMLCALALFLLGLVLDLLGKLRQQSKKTHKQI